MSHEWRLTWNLSVLRRSSGWLLAETQTGSCLRSSFLGIRIGADFSGGSMRKVSPKISFCSICWLLSLYPVRDYNTCSFIEQGVKQYPLSSTLVLGMPMWHSYHWPYHNTIARNNPATPKHRLSLLPAMDSNGYSGIEANIMQNESSPHQGWPLPQICTTTHPSLHEHFQRKAISLLLPELNEYCGAYRTWKIWGFFKTHCSI